MKKIYLFLLALLPMTASADDSGICGYKTMNNSTGEWVLSNNVKWTYVESTHILTISGNGAMDSFGFWNEDDPMIGTTPWEQYKEDIQSVVVQSGVTSVSGFFFCKNLTSVSLPSTIEVIEPYAFCQCAFSSINIPSSVKSIGFSAFSACSNLSSVIIPKSVTGIGYGVFMGCSSLESIQVESGNTVYDSRNNCNAIIWDWTEENGIKHVELLAGCKNTVIPDGVLRIMKLAFGGCSGLTSLTIPQSVEGVECLVFANCSNLTAVYCKAAEVPFISSGSGFFRTESLGSVENATLYVPSVLVEKYKSGLDIWGNPSRWGSQFKAVMPIESASDPKCATPTIKAENGILKFECATEGVEFHYNVQISPDYETPYSGTYNKTNDSGINGVVLPYATISVYASKSGYSLSDSATLKVKLSNGKFGDLNGDGVVNVADHVELSNIIFEQDK